MSGKGGGDIQDWDKREYPGPGLNFILRKFKLIGTDKFNLENCGRMYHVLLTGAISLLPSLVKLKGVPADIV